ncbi:MAG: thiamine pyrophosphate-dependent enzyme, partial [Pseudomonadota bacterium]|nr:thiamine pyrophosphate-dependent enzyme [Pseudomonadota bacterium]
PQTKGHTDAIEAAVELLANAERPIFYGGGGIINSGPAACKKFTNFVHETGYPSTLTLMGLGALPGSDPQFVGMLGMHGTYEANMAMHQCDVMVCVGARFDDRITGRVDAFSPNSKKIHIDIDPSSINKNVRVDVPIVGDVGTIIQQMAKAWKALKKRRTNGKAVRAWWKQIEEWRAVNCLAYSQDDKTIKPQYAIERLYELTKKRDTFITTEVGQHQMWAAQFYKFEKPNRWMTSGGLGTMGYGFPAALGVQMAYPEKLVVDIAGEASIMMNIQELSTAIQHRLPVKIFILNNQYMGMVRQWQELLHGGRYSESYTDALPNFVKLAESFGAVGLRTDKPSELDDLIKEMIATDNVVIADIGVDQMENCLPMIPSGSAHNEMILGSEAQSFGKDGVSDAGKVLV